jgi:hypothetical protein
MMGELPRGIRFASVPTWRRRFRAGNSGGDKNNGVRFDASQAYRVRSLALRSGSRVLAFWPHPLSSRGGQWQSGPCLL